MGIAAGKRRPSRDIPRRFVGAGERQPAAHDRKRRTTHWLHEHSDILQYMGTWKSAVSR